MSHQHHEHPTQSVAPGAEPEQAGDNPPPQWVNPEQAAAAEFQSTTKGPEDRPANTNPAGDDARE